MLNKSKVQEQIDQLKVNPKVLAYDNFKKQIKTQEGLISVDWLVPFRVVREGHDSLFQWWSVTDAKVREVIETNNLASTAEDADELVAQSTGFALKVGPMGKFMRSLGRTEWHHRADELLELLRAELSSELNA